MDMEHFICPISQEVFIDPVMLVESGHTYERKVIEEWFDKKKGRLDPLTGKKLKKWPPVLVPNIIVRQAVEQYQQQAQASTVHSVPPPADNLSPLQVSAVVAAHEAPSGSDATAGPAAVIAAANQPGTAVPDITPGPPPASQTVSFSPDSASHIIPAAAAYPVLSEFMTTPTLVTGHPASQAAPPHEWPASAYHPFIGNAAPMAAALHMPSQDVGMRDTAWGGSLFLTQLHYPVSQLQGMYPDPDLDVAIRRSMGDVRSAGHDTVRHFRDHKLDEGIARSLASVEPGQLHAPDEFGNSPLHLAVQSGHKFSVRVLLERGVDVNARNQDGWTPLHMAAEYCTGGDEDIWHALLEYGASLYALNKDDSTPLHVAVRNQREAMVDGFVQQAARQRGKKGCSALLDMQNKDGNTALHLAALNGDSLRIPSRLVRHRCNLKTANKDGLTAKRLAENLGHAKLGIFLARELCSASVCTVM